MGYQYYYQMSLGTLYIGEKKEAISYISFTKPQYLNDFYEEKETPLILKAKKQLQEYLEGNRTVFDLPLILEGTSFQKKVWEALYQIPYGTTVSYQEIAKQIDCPKGCRAVGMANNKNRIMIVIPCHRVIGANGKMVGYGGGLPIKERLLTIEGVKIKNGEIYQD